MKQIINNNALIAIDRDEQEKVVIAKGIGWKNKSGTRIDEKSYPNLQIFVSDSAEYSTLRKALDDIPSNLFELSRKLLKKENEEEEKTLTITSVLSLADHLHETVKRLQKGISLHNVLTNEIRTFYSHEYELSHLAREELEREYQLILDEDEMAFVAMHLINLSLGNMNVTSMTIQITDELVDIVRRVLGIELKKNTHEYSRFITHLKYFSQRIIGKQCMETSYEKGLAEFIRKNYAKAWDCAVTMKNYIFYKYQYQVREDEVVFLSLHLENLLMRSKK